MRKQQLRSNEEVAIPDMVVDEEILEVKDTLLDEWLELVRNPPTGKIFVRNMFPTEAHRSIA